MPPLELRIGMGPFEDPDLFRSSGRETLDLIGDTIGVAPHDRVLDLGCGCGRVALPLLSVLSERGSYAGLDADSECIDWCSKAISPLHPRFHFTHLDVESAAYNPDGVLSSDSATLPYEDAEFDRALISSLFTHMTEEGVARYLAELGRVMKPNGLMLLSALLMNEQTAVAIPRDTTLFEFRTPLGSASWTLDPSRPLEAVSLGEGWLTKQAALNGFAVLQTRYGNWRDIRGWVITHDWLMLQRHQVDR